MADSQTKIVADRHVGYSLDAAYSVFLYFPMLVEHVCRRTGHHREVVVRAAIENWIDRVFDPLIS